MHVWADTVIANLDFAPGGPGSRRLAAQEARRAMGAYLGGLAANGAGTRATTCSRASSTTTARTAASPTWN
ncbi:hypothetical protein GCM10020221_13030 [Streptomyces thioluteus]|uniref:Uncharacterized protein n=1 Tax=Streptomyces thioluteus TaxID=66431 RepID=A0ABP6J2G4_STRTU